MLLNQSWIGFSALGLLCLMQAAQAQGVPTLTPEQAQHLSRDLTPTTAQEFFKQGQAQLEREIRLLDRHRLPTDPSLLKIDPVLQDPESFKSFSSEVVPLQLPSKSPRN